MTFKANNYITLGCTISKPVHGDIVLHGVSMKDVISNILRKHENTSLLTDDGIEEVSNDLVFEFAMRLHLRDANDK